MDSSFKLDRTAFRATTAADADDHVAYWRSRPYSERLAAAWFLIKQAYSINDDTRLDRSVFEKRKR